MTKITKNDFFDKNDVFVIFDFFDVLGHYMALFFHKTSKSQKTSFSSFLTFLLIFVKIVIFDFFDEFEKK